MEKQNPDFEAPEATKQITKQEVDLLLPPTENENEVIYNALQKIFHKAAPDAAVPKHRAGQPSRKQLPPDNDA